jgi:hypothetical protein
MPKEEAKQGTTVQSTPLPSVRNKDFTMLKIASIAIGLITILAMAPTSQAMTFGHPVAIQTAQGEMHAQVGGTLPAFRIWIRSS